MNKMQTVWLGFYMLHAKYNSRILMFNISEIKRRASVFGNTDIGRLQITTEEDGFCYNFFQSSSFVFFSILTVINQRELSTVMIMIPGLACSQTYG